MDQALRDVSDVSDVNSPAKVFVGGLSKLTTTESLQQYVYSFGLIVRDCTVLSGKGFGFITFTTVDDAETFVANQVNGGAQHVIDGKTVDAKKALPKHIYDRNANYNNQNNNGGNLMQQLQQNIDMVTKLFVGGLPPVRRSYTQFIYRYFRIAEMTIL